MDKHFELASTYIRGQGIEIGALHQPLQVHANVDVKYVDHLNKNDLLNLYPELKDLHIVSPDIIDDIETLNKIEDDKYDFCISNHVFEHMANPIGAFQNWLRILKTGGILYLSVPDINNPLDYGRELTTIEHLIEDETGKNDIEDYKHFVECAKYWNGTTDAKQIEKIAQKNWDKQYSIHYHTFNKKSLENFFHYLTMVLKNQFKITESINNEINGVTSYLYIIEKTDYEIKIFDMLLNRKNKESKQVRCDVIIPVYNAYYDFIKCLYSALKHQSEYRIICINDKSTDHRISELFSKMKSFENENVVLLDNPKNMGFIKTVNKGMEYSKNDVILLNSDTIVTKNFTIKLNHCANLNNEIATVTPLSNNATICSVPNFCQDNEIPEGFTVDAFADFIQKTSLKQYPEIPTAVGFCMYIKRRVIDQVGYFDDIIFGNGYGEENDFCLRAINAGYKNVLCDDTFIFHKGAASFLTNQKELMSKNLKIISKKYPDYLPDVAKFCQSNQLKLIHENIKYRMITWDIIRKKRILFILHHLGGGTEYHVMDLIKSMESLYIFYTLQVENNQMILTEFNGDHTLRYTFPLSHLTGFSVLYNEECNKIYRIVVNTFHIDLIHIHHLILHTLDIFDIAKEQNIPIFMTLHDYYVVCPSINLLDEKYELCHKNNNIEKCNNCLSMHFYLPMNFIKQWRKNFQKSLNKCDLIISPNPSVFEILKEYYYFSEYNTQVIEHGHKNEVFEADNILPDLDMHNQNGTFHIAHIGSLVKHKGSEIFYTTAQSKKLMKKTRWSIFGESNICTTCGYNSDLNIHMYGKYNNFKELKSLLKAEKIDLVFLPAICPETFSYTLSEAWALGIPVLVSDMGALKERVERVGGGWVVDVSDLKKVEDKILEIIESPESYMDKKEAIKVIHLKTLEEMQNEYESYYNKFITSTKSVYASDFILSNIEIIESIERVNQRFISEIQDASSESLAKKFFKCLKVNGPSYTIKRVYIFIKKKLMQVS